MHQSQKITLRRLILGSPQPKHALYQTDHNIPTNNACSHKKERQESYRNNDKHYVNS
jgi:hypothetical protein